MAQILDAQRELARRELARRSFYDFVTHTKPNFIGGWFNRKLAGLIDYFITAVQNKESPRIILTIGPRFGKSEFVSRRLPAYAMARFPGLEFIGATHTQTLADTNGADVREILVDKSFKDLFSVEIDPRFAAKDYMKLSNGSSCKEVGIGVGLPGFGANILSIDDVFPGRREAESQLERDRVWDWLKGVAFNRIMPGGGALLTMTRWHPDDPVGRILSSPEADFWEIFEFPAIAEVDEEHRKVGESLHPERWSVEELMIRKRETDERGWASLYQCRPYLLGGNWLSRDTFKWYDEIPTNLNYFLASDYATSTKATADNTCVGAWGMDERGDLWLNEDIIYGKLDPLDAVRRTVRLGKKTGARMLSTEKGVIANTLEPLFRIVMSEEQYYLVLERYTRSAAKHIYALAIKGMMEAGKIHLPKSKKALIEPLLLRFQPDADGEDDMVDMFATAGLMVQKAVIKPAPITLPAIPVNEPVVVRNSRMAREGYAERKREMDGQSEEKDWY